VINLSFKKVLSQAIDNSGLTIRDISKKCKELGVPITHVYVSQLKSGKSSSPSIEVCNVLSQVCNIDPNLLIIESYLDKAPTAIVDFLELIRFGMSYEKFHNQNIDNLSYQEMKEIVEQFKLSIKEQPLAEFIMKYDLDALQKIIDAYVVLHTRAVDAVSIEDFNEDIEHWQGSLGELISKLQYEGINRDLIQEVKDDSMEPLFRKGSKVFNEICEYKNGDILSFVNLKDGVTYIRQYYKKENMIIFTSLNNNYEPMVYNENQVRFDTTEVSEAVIMIIGKPYLIHTYLK
jgi:transcriptional regulator with XRE-family HTH domain